MATVRFWKTTNRKKLWNCQTAKPGLWFGEGERGQASALDPTQMQVQKNM